MYEQYIIDKCVANDPSIMEREAKYDWCKNHDVYTEEDYCDKCVSFRDIWLHDVLGAIGKRKNEYTYFVDGCGGIHEFFTLKGRLDLRTIGVWNLKKSLHDQTDETKEAVAKILGFTTN